jgi:hypothetical protein
MIGEDWNFESVPTKDAPETLKFNTSSQPQWMIMVPEGKPNEFVLLSDGKEVGTITLKDGRLHFDGHIDESAAVLFLALKKKVDEYMDEQARLYAD